MLLTLLVLMPLPVPAQDVLLRLMEAQAPAFTSVGRLFDDYDARA